MKKRIGIVVSLFNSEITLKMKEKAIHHAKNLGADVAKVVEVPGAFEIPLAVKRLLEDKKIDAVATLGTVIKGGTNHDEVVAHSVARKLLNLSIKYDKPVSLGISGPNITWNQSEKRIKEYAQRSIETILKVLEKK